MNPAYSPLISTIIPYYNPRSDFFQEAIESVLSQSYRNWEIIIVNDGSNNESRKSLESFIESINDKRISILQLDKNYGVSIARNKGIDFAKGDIITFLDSDDLHLPWYYNNIINCFSKNPEFLVLHTGNTLYFKIYNFIKGAHYHESHTLSKEKENNHIYMCFPRLTLKKECLKKIKFDSNLFCSEDTDLSLQIVNDPVLLKKSIIMPGPGYLYRFHRSNLRLTNNWDLVLRSMILLFDKYNDKDSPAYKSLVMYQNMFDNWKFSRELYEYLKTGSISTYLSKTLFSSSSFKDKIKSIRALFRIIIVYKFLTPCFAINFSYTNALLNLKYNKCKKLKKIFQEHLGNLGTEDKSYLYAKKIFQRIF